MNVSGPIFLHAGLGSAAADEFHRFLMANRDALALAGYVLADGADAPDGSRPAAAAADGPVILSLPGLAGPPEGLLAGQFFSAAEARARALRAGLGRPVARMALAVQPYDTLYRMAWRRAAVTRAVDPFARYAARMADAPGGLCDLVEMLGDVLGAETIAVVAAPPSQRRMLQALLPGVALPFPSSHAAVPVLTDTAVAAFQRMRQQGIALRPGQAERLMAFHAGLPQGAEEPGYDGLALADLRGRYVADLTILSRHAGVTVETEAMPAMPQRRLIAAE
jgi:hypothetical protein